jgi:hypothetical protein
MKRFYRSAVSLALATAALSSAAGAATGGPPTLAKDAPKMKAMALTSQGVPTDFAQVFRKLYTPAEIAAQGTWSGSQLRYWGYEGGYEVQFDRGSDATDPAQISSDVGAYKTVTGARRALTGNGTHCQLNLWSELKLPTRIGDAAHLCTVQTTVRGYQVKVYFVVWTIGRFKGAVTETSLTDSPLGVAEVVALAKTQAARMKVLAR